MHNRTQPRLIKFELDKVDVLNFKKLIIFYCGFSTKVRCALQLQENI